VIKNAILIFFILWSTFIFVLCLKNIFIWSLLNSLHAFTFVPSCFFYIQLLYIIYIISRNHTILWNSWYVKLKKWVGRSKKEEYDELGWNDFIMVFFYMLNAKTLFHSHYLHWHMFIC
jgi:hypothetical protein